MDECNHVTLCDIKVCRISHAHDSEQRAFCPGSIPIQISSNARQKHSATRYDANMQAKPPKSAKDRWIVRLSNASKDACPVHVLVSTMPKMQSFVSSAAVWPARVHFDYCNSL